MKIFTVYCHPSEDSFTRCVRDSFMEGAAAGGHQIILSDLYKMNFKTDMSEQEYLRDSNYRDTPDIAVDVLEEHRKIQEADGIAFIYPVFWTEAPAKLVGWFDRVLTYGFAYALEKDEPSGGRRMKMLEKALIMCTAGNTIDRLQDFGLLDAMKKVMLGDRLFGRVKTGSFMVFDGMTKEYAAQRAEKRDAFLAQAYEAGRTFFS